MKKVLTKNEREYLKNMLTTRDNKLTLSAQRAIVALKTNNSFRTYIKIGTGRDTRQVKTEIIKDMELIIKILDIKHECLNDAPRGGKLGEYIIITDEQINEISAVIKNITGEK